MCVRVCVWCSVPWEVHGCGGVVVVVVTGEGEGGGRGRRRRKDRASSKEAQHEWAERARKSKEAQPEWAVSS